MIDPNNSRAHAAMGSVIQVATRLGVLLLGALLMAYLTRRLGTAEYGRYAVAVMLVNWLTIGIAVATGSTTVRLVAGQQHGRRYAVTLAQTVALFSAAIGAVVAGFAGPIADLFRSPNIAPLLRLLSLDLALGTVAGIYVNVLIARGRYALSAATSLSAACAQLLTAFFFVERGYLALGACAAAVIGSAVQLALGRAVSGIPFFSRDRVAFGDLWGHARLLAGAQLALRVTQSMDLLAVKYFANSAALAGLYAGGQNISQAGFMLFGPTQNVLLRSMAKSRSDGNIEEACKTATLYLRGAMTYGALLCALSVKAKDIALFLLGPVFADSGTVLAILLWAVAFRVVAGTGRTLIAAVGEKASIMVPLLLLIALGLIAYAIAIPRGGIMAAAWVALALAISAGLTSLREGLRLAGIGFPWASLARIVCAAGSAAAVAAIVPSDGWRVLVSLSAACLTYAAMLVLLNEWRSGNNHLRSLRNTLGG
ncbi:MAG: lipopolysaccharide biosynthesis protein [Chthoniobacterales bacterium]|nr:lipopolysaccharide biosynthesis protein [Chthoniobacterales bacterium]